MPHTTGKNYKSKPGHKNPSEMKKSMGTMPMKMPKEMGTMSMGMMAKKHGNTSK